MGLRGPAPKPTAQKKAQGTYRLDRAAGGLEPDHPRVSNLAAPDYLAPLARAKWNELAPTLDRSGVLRSTDLDTLAAYCSAFGQWQPAQEVLAQILDEVPATNDEDALAAWKRKLSSYRMVTTEALKQMQVWGDRLGLSPSQRTKIAAEPSKGVPIGVSENGGGSSGLLN